MVMSKIRTFKRNVLKYSFIHKHTVTELLRKFQKGFTYSQLHKIQEYVGREH